MEKVYIVNLVSGFDYEGSESIVAGVYLSKSDAKKRSDALIKDWKHIVYGDYAYTEIVEIEIGGEKPINVERFSDDEENLDRWD